MGGSSKKVTVGYKYYLGMHMVLCHGPVDKLTRISVDGRSAWAGENTGGTINIKADGLFGGEKREGGISGPVDVLMGSPSQGVNGYLNSHLGSNVPAFRGVLSVVLKHCYLGMNPYLKKWAFRATRIHTRQEGLPQWYSEKAEVALMSFNFQYDDLWKYRVVSPQEGGAMGSPSEFISPSYSDADWLVGKGGFGSGGPGGGFGVGTYVSSGTIGKGIWIRRTVQVSLPKLAPNIEVEVYHDDGGWLWWNGEAIPLSPTENYFRSFAVIPSYKIQANNTMVVQVLDAIPGGSTSHIYAGVRLRSLGGGISDMNPAHIIRECLTDPDWGMGYQEVDIDDVSFRACADTLWGEGMGMSLLWDRQISIEGFIQEVIKHIDATLYVSRSTGKFILKLIRADYNPQDLLKLGPHNLEKLENPTRTSFGELTNSVSVNYWDTLTGNEASVTVQDPALIQMQGAVINTALQYPGFTNHTIASRVAQRDLRTLSSALLSCTVIANQDARGLNIGDAFSLSWPDFELLNVPMRVTGISFGDGRSNKIRISCTQDVFTLPDVGVVVDAEDGWLDIGGPPEPSPFQIATEAPYFEIVQTVGQADADLVINNNPEVGYILGAAARSEPSINAAFFVDAGSGYEDTGTVDFCAYNTVVTAVGKMDNTIELSEGLDMDLVSPGSHAQIGDELIRIDNYNSETGLLTVGRGVLDTVPNNHSVGTAVLFWDLYNAVDPTEYVAGEIVRVKILPISGSGMLPEASAQETSVTLSGRAARPYPPGDFKINGLYFPDFFSTTEIIELSWTHRDRVQQTGATLIGFTDGNVGPETGVEYIVEAEAFFPDNTSNVYYSENVGDSTYHEIDPSMDPLPEGAIQLEIRVWAERDGLRSLYPQPHRISLLQAPYDLKAKFTE